MKNLAKFLLFVLLLSLGISLLYDYRLKNLLPRRTSEKYTLAGEPAVNPKEVASLEALNQERRTLVKQVIPAVVAVKTSKKIGIRRQYGMTSARVFRSAADPLEITVHTEWPSADQARAYVTSPDLKAGMANAGVLSQPDVGFLEAL